MQYVAASEPSSPDHENEDWFSISPNLVTVLDGATARTDTGCRHGVAWFTAHLGAAFSAFASDFATSLDVALAHAISATAAQHPECELGNPGTPSAAICAIRIGHQSAEYLCLGDVSLVLEHASSIEVITDDRVEGTALAERRRADQYPIGSAEKQAALIDMKHAELASRNQPGGFWVAAADPTVSKEATVGAVDRARLRSCTVLTDGAARPVRAFGTMTWKGLLDLVRSQGPAALLASVRKTEAIDPVGARWPRNKRGDDATVIYLPEV